jgi:hypothetical protein
MPIFEKVTETKCLNAIILSLVVFGCSTLGAIVIYIYHLQDISPGTIKDIIIPVLALLGASLGGTITIYIYYRNSQLRRAEWLYSLFEKFYCQKQYSEIRQLLENYDPDRLKMFELNLPKHSERVLEEKLVDYLNFFEFIASLWLLKQLPIEEIRMMFDYYIRQLFKYEFIMDYLKREGFEGLIKLIGEVREGPQKI